MATALAYVFEHHLWANLRLVDALAGLDAALLRASAAGTYGAVDDTLQHLVISEERYVLTAQGESLDPPSPLGTFPGFDDIRARLARTGAALIEIAARADPAQLLHVARGGQTFEMSIMVPLTQAINHATEHRAHIVTVLSARGVEPVSLDAWTYMGAQSHDA